MCFEPMIAKRASKFALLALALASHWGCSSPTFSDTGAIGGDPGRGDGAGSGFGGAAGSAGGSAENAGADRSTAGGGHSGDSASAGDDAAVAGSTVNTVGGSGTGGASTSGGLGGIGGAVTTGGKPGTGGSAGGGSAGGGSAGAGPTETLHYSGRWDLKSDRAVTVNSGSYVTAQFTGTGITASFDVSVNDKSDTPTVAWRLDQATTWQVAEVTKSLVMASGIAAGTHSLTMIARGLDENKSRWTPPLVSSITFLGLTATAGALQPTPRPPQPKLEILGDSITEGVIVRGSSYQGHTGQCWINDAAYSYPSLTGMKLDADYRQVGFGYQGLLKGGDGGVPAANDSFNWIYKGVPRDSWQPDMVVINQGTNDSTKPAATFKTAYGAFIGTIRKAYPYAKIVALRPFNGAQADPIKAVVSQSNATGDARVFFVDTTGWLGSSDFNGLHPNVQGSAKAATALVSAIQKIGFP